MLKQKHSHHNIAVYILSKITMTSVEVTLSVVEPTPCLVGRVAVVDFCSLSLLELSMLVECVFGERETDVCF